MDTFREAGVDLDEIAEVDDVDGLKGAVAGEERSFVPDGLVVARSDVDVVVEAIGIPEFGALHAYTAITEGTHVVMVTVEADTVVGPTLAKLADNVGVTYSMA